MGPDRQGEDSFLECLQLYQRQSSGSGHRADSISHAVNSALQRAERGIRWG